MTSCPRRPSTNTPSIPLLSSSSSLSRSPSSSTSTPTPLKPAFASSHTAGPYTSSASATANTPVPSVPVPPSVHHSSSAPEMTTTHTTNTTSSPARTNATTPPRTLSDFPRNVLGEIAYHLVVDDQGVGQHPSALLPLMLTCRTIHDAISFDEHPALYNRLFRATFDHAALTRRYLWMKAHMANTAGRGQKTFDLFADPRAWATDYKTRWEQSWRMRQVVKHAKIEVPGICDKEQLTADLWNVWFLLTENDGKNINFLAEQCHFQAWIVVYYKEDMLKDSLVPGYPQESGHKALGIWCALLSGTDLSAEQTPAEVDEKIFIMRPYVFACAKYDVTYAPWHHRRLPLCDPTCKDHEPDVTMRSKAMPYKRFGYTWRRAPPHFVLGAYLVFLRLLERHSGRMGFKPGSSTFSRAPADAGSPGLYSTTRIMPSIYHDREWQRNSVCQDPHTSPGLSALAFRGELEGYWRGKFLFYDFDMYRQILAGHIRGVYTGTFAEQAIEMDVKETVVRVRKEDLGGKGSMLCAGFDDEEDGEAEIKKIKEGYGNEVIRDLEQAADEEGWTKEILLSGRARTSWGWATVRGRVRSWDGLVTLAIAYSRHVMGRWLWRGYLHTGGNFIGRWRDTFTSEHLRGYEGAFGMVRAGDIFYPAHFPTRLEDSLGVDVSGPPASGPQGALATTVAQGAPAMPSSALLSRSPAGPGGGTSSSARLDVGVATATATSIPDLGPVGRADVILSEGPGEGDAVRSMPDGSGRKAGRARASREREIESGSEGDEQRSAKRARVGTADAADDEE